MLNKDVYAIYTDNDERRGSVKELFFLLMKLWKQDINMQIGVVQREMFGLNYLKRTVHLEVLILGILTQKERLQLNMIFN